MLGFMMGNRFDRREDLDKAICDFLDRGGPVAGLDVSLSRMGAVDLDLLVECLHEMKSRMASSALTHMQADAKFAPQDAGAPLTIVA